MLTGEGRFDVSQSTHFTYPLRTEGAKSILIELAPDGNGKCSGSVAVFLGQAVSGAPPWRTVSASSLRVYPSPETDFVTIVPSSGALGICTVSLSTENLGVGIYPFEGGGGGGSAVIAYDTYVVGLSGIIAHYPMNEKTGLVLTDAANGHNGTYNAQGVTLAASVAPRGNLAPAFDGVRGSAQANIPLVTTGFSCACWFYMNETLPGNNAAICSNTPDIYSGFMMGYFNSNAAGQYAFSGPRIGAVGSVLGAWQFGVITWDGVTFRAYLDGALIGSQAIANVTFSGQTVWSNLQGNCVNCSICRTSFFSRALTPAEIAVLLTAT